jgi:hypothetical protein
MLQRHFVTPSIPALARPRVKERTSGCHCEEAAAAADEAISNRRLGIASRLRRSQ